MHQLSSEKNLLEMKVATLTAELQRLKDLNAQKNVDLNEKDVHSQTMHSRMVTVSAETERLRVEMQEQQRVCTEAKEQRDSMERKAREMEKSLSVWENKLKDCE